MKASKEKGTSLPTDAALPATGPVSRRRFFSYLWSVLGLAALAELVWLAVSFLRPPRAELGDAQTAAVVAAGAVESFAAGSVTAFQQGQFYLVRLENGGFLALSFRCTHLGCTVPWVEKEQKFICPCHASVFDITGNVIAAPAPRALDLLPLAVVNNVVRVNTARRIKRSGFEAGQVTFASES